LSPIAKDGAGMKRRIWLVVLCLYAIAGIVDGVSRAKGASRSADAPVGPATVAVAFCAGLFWPLDIAVRQLLAPRR
jgi:hypothetical protein